MSEDILNLILHRLDSIESGQTERFGRIDQRFDQVDQRFDQVDQRFDQVDQRFAQVDQRLERIEREQTRLRTDVVNQMDRVLLEIQTFKDDMTVAMAFASRSDASTDATAAAQRTMQSQLSRLRSRVERLEGKQDEAG